MVSSKNFFSLMPAKLGAIFARPQAPNQLATLLCPLCCSSGAMLATTDAQLIVLYQVMLGALTGPGGTCLSARSVSLVSHEAALTFNWPWMQLHPMWNPASERGS